MDEILDAMRGHGLDPGPIVANGKIQRFFVDKSDTKKSGWYVCYQNHTRQSGQLFYVCVFGNYKTNEKHTFTTLSGELSSEDKKHTQVQIKKAQNKSNEDKEQEQEKTALEVLEFWNSLKVDGSSNYLEKKQISDIGNSDLGIKFDNQGNFYVPLRDDNGKLWSYQRIGWDGSKYFKTGGRAVGCYHSLGDVGESDRVYITEGFATAASIFKATGQYTVCTFSASNVLQVCGYFKDKQLIICGDDDRWKEKNVGREKAEEAAKRYFTRATFPVFTKIETKPTDFNDLHCLEGIEKVKEQLESISIDKKIALYALGHKDKEYFFTSTYNRQVINVSSFVKSDFLKLMPMEYWEAMFPGQKARVDWEDAENELIRQAHKKGFFQPRNVRGSGVWDDGGRVVINMGSHLVVDGNKIELGQIKSKYFYTLGNSLEEFKDNPLSVLECKTLIETASKFKWTKRDSGILLVGAMVAAKVCGALPVRPHVWVTGSAQTGKTTLLERLIKPILGESKLYVQGGTSEAGVRQALKADAVPVLFDEFETNGPTSAENIEACIELMRSAWSESGAMIVKGGAQGNASYFQVRFSAIVSSIRTRLTSDADKGRFAVIELAPHGSDQRHWQQLSTLLAKIDSEYSQRLFARAIKMMPIMLTNFRLLKLALAKRASSRFGDQYGMILAGYSILLQDEAIDEHDADYIAEMVDLRDEKESATIADHDDALTHLLTSKISVQGKNEELIGRLISTVWHSMQKPAAVLPDEERNALLRIGIRIDSENVSVVASGHAELEMRVWRGTKWSKIWGNSLKRLNGAEYKNVRVGGKVFKCAVLPSDIFDFESKS